MEYLDGLAQAAGYTDYNDYLASPHWRDFSSRVRRRKCYACGAGWERADGLHVHHATYERLGAERDGDVVTLCRSCHELAHLVVNEGLVRLEEAHGLVLAMRRRQYADILNKRWHR